MTWPTAQTQSLRFSLPSKFFCKKQKQNNTMRRNRSRIKNEQPDPFSKDKIIKKDWPFRWPQMLKLADKDFEAATVVLIKDVEENTLMMNEKESHHNEWKEISSKKIKPINLRNGAKKYWTKRKGLRNLLHHIKTSL